MKISIKNIVISLVTILTLLATVLLVVGVLGKFKIITSTSNSSNIGMIVAGAILCFILLILLIAKFALAHRYKLLTEDEVKELSSSTENYSISLAFYIFLNPIKAHKQGFSYGDFRLV
ncbi:MAG: hypothetical protein K2K73_03115 [Ureaplasma sp.]|nr:hypothetical protein [Ureaplasma sp.]